MSTDSAATEYERILKAARTHIKESMDIYKDMVKRHQAEYEQIAKANRESADQLQSMFNDIHPGTDTSADDDLSYLDD